MDEGKFWICIWSIVGAVIAVIALTIAGSIQASNAKIVEMVKAGADPIAASCAIGSLGSTSGDAVICAKATKQQ